MKKLLALVLALMMLTVTGICFAETTEEPECLQVWDATAMYIDGVRNEAGSFPAISLFLFDDQSARLESGEKVYTGTVVTTHDPLGYLVTIGENEVSFIYDEANNTLSMTDNSGNTIVLEQRVDLPAELNAESIDEFQGTWHVTSVIKEGRWISLDSEEGASVKESLHSDDPTIVIEGNTVNLFGAGELTAEFVDGALTATVSDGTMHIVLTEGDGIVCYGESDTYTIITHMYCNK